MRQKKDAGDKWNKQEADKRSDVPLPHAVVQNYAVMIPLLDTVPAGVAVAWFGRTGLRAYLAAAETVVNWLRVDRIGLKAGLIIRAKV